MHNSCDPMDLACQAPLSMGYCMQEYWSGLPFPSPILSELYLTQKTQRFVIIKYKWFSALLDYEVFLNNTPNCSNKPQLVAEGFPKVGGQWPLM